VSFVNIFAAHFLSVQEKDAQQNIEGIWSRQEGLFSRWYQYHASGTTITFWAFLIL